MRRILYSLVFIIFAIGTTTSVPTPSLDLSTKDSVPASENITLGAQITSVTAAEDSRGIKDIEDVPDDGWEFENTTHVDTRRILYSKAVGTGQRPYMVYLQLTKESAKAHKYRGWLCGGVIVDRSYVLTSAACVEDADRFYVVSGTNKFVDSFDYKTDQCVCNNRRRVVWKCVPKNYKFDFQDSIKWSANDIAIVKVDKPFKFGVTEKGCQFPTNLICYNNISRELEKPGTKGYIAGWGSQGNFREGVYRKQQEPHETKNAKCLQQAKVCLMDNEHCAKKWAQKFRSIISQYMICTKDVMKKLSEECDKRYANCTDVEKSRRDDDSDSTAVAQVDLGRHLRNSDDYAARRTSHGGFCENDHGGPLIVKYKGKDRVIGVISACKIDPKSHSCHGPFLYTSVFKNRQFISCSIHKDVEESCRRVFRTGITHEEWDVNWDDVEESGEEEGSSKKVNKNDDKSSNSDENTKDKLRDSEKSPKHEEKENKEKLKVEKPKSEKKEKKSSKKHKKSKSKSKSHKSSSKKKEEAEEKDAASYQSSKDDDVNEPDAE